MLIIEIEDLIIVSVVSDEIKSFNASGLSVGLLLFGKSFFLFSCFNSKRIKYIIYKNLEINCGI